MIIDKYTAGFVVFSSCVSLEAKLLLLCLAVLVPVSRKQQTTHYHYLRPDHFKVRVNAHQAEVARETKKLAQKTRQRSTQKAKEPICEIAKARNAYRSDASGFLGELLFYFPFSSVSQAKRPPVP
jgi:hypothetical protein